MIAAIVSGTSGTYRVVGEPKDWKIAQSFGDYRITRKTWRQVSPDSAITHALTMAGPGAEVTS